MFGIRHHLNVGILLALGMVPRVCSGEPEALSITADSPQVDVWQFTLAMPGWIAGLNGDVGIGNTISSVDVDPGAIIRNLDMVASLRGEASNGSFGVTGDFLYARLSSSAETDAVVDKVKLEVDQIIGDLGLRWRILENERDYLDVIAGFRYVNLDQTIELHADEARTQRVSGNLVDEIGVRLADSLTDGKLREVIQRRVGSRLSVLRGRDPEVPVAPLANHLRASIIDRIQHIIDARRDELADALRDRAEAATAELRAEAQARVDKVKADLSRKIAKSLDARLNSSQSRRDDWFDPYIGIRGRHYFSEQFYFTGKGDIGGFDIGSDFTWQAEAAFGWHFTPRVFTEVGYRALGIDFREDGLTFDTVTHGFQINLGMVF